MNVSDYKNMYLLVAERGGEEGKGGGGGGCARKEIKVISDPQWRHSPQDPWLARSNPPWLLPPQ